MSADKLGYVSAQDSDAIWRYKTVYKLYSTAIDDLEIARRGLVAGNVRECAEAVSRAISTICGLLAAVDVEAGQEAGSFLVSLYTKMIQRLALVPIDNNISDIDHSLSYLKQLKSMWEIYVLNETANISMSGMYDHRGADGGEGLKVSEGLH